MNGISLPRIFGRSRVLFVCLLLCVVVITKLWWVAEIGSKALLVPLPAGHDLHHFRRSRSLQDYTDTIQVLIEPSSTPCDGANTVPVLVLVSSSPSRVHQRAVIRSTWARHLPTFFVLGVDEQGVHENFADTYLEAKEYGDIIVLDLQDHYQNLTLKTALMLQWSLKRCPQADFVFKTDDDVLVNPWRLGDVVKENPDAKLLGYMKNNSRLHRDEYNKWFVPRWLRAEDRLPEYLSGTGYLISGEYTEKILKAAKRVPLLNLEDVYFTYLVAKEALGLELTHDRRLNPYKPMISTGCSYFRLASVHSLGPEEMKTAWTKLEKVVSENDGCEHYGFLSSDLFLY